MRYLFIILLLCIYVQLSLGYVVNSDYQKKFFLLKVEEERITQYKVNLINAIISKESEGKDTAMGDMVGILQIRPVMVREVNNILGYIKYTLKDRIDRMKAIEMFRIYTDHHTPDWNMELVCRRWNGGYKGETKFETYQYYREVKQILNKTI